jgi:hypothetical protein
MTVGMKDSTEVKREAIMEQAETAHRSQHMRARDWAANGVAAQITNAGDRKVGCTARQRLALFAISRRIPCRAGTSR